MRTLFALMLAAVSMDSAFAHGGGCRKDLPPGQGCHMDRKAGEMHCH